MYFFLVYPSSKFLDMSIELEVTLEARGHTGLEKRRNSREEGSWIQVL